jgi:HSP20 family protein
MERWQPYREAMSLRDAMDRLFQDSWVSPGARPGGQQQSMVPVNVDVHETDQGYELCASLPGWKPEDINITVHGDTLTISGQHKADERKEDGRQYHLRERRFGSFARSFSFPGPIDSANAQARYENGELILTIPKAEQARPRRIQINNAQQQRMPTPNQPGASQPTPNREMASAAGRPGSGGQGSDGGTTIPVEGDAQRGSSRPRPRKSTS